MNLLQCLEATPWYRLWGIAKVLNVKTKHKPTKEELAEIIKAFIIRELPNLLKTFPSEEMKALQTLVSRSGLMPLTEFTARFGPIRPYKPWRPDSPRHPWRKPISPAESLWYKGLIFKTTHQTSQGPRDFIIIPSDLLPLLPKPEETDFASYLQESVPAASFPAHNIVLDAVFFLSLLNRTDIAPIRGRWLPLRALRDLNRRLSIPEDLTGIRSELQTGKLRFIHFLCEAGGLVALTGPYLKPSLRGWEWLNLIPQEQLKALWEIWPGRAGEQRELWARYRLPGEEPSLIDLLLRYLKRCPPGRWFTAASFLKGILDLEGEEGEILPATPWWEEEKGIDRARDALGQLLEGPLFWMGTVEKGTDPDGNSLFRITPQGAWLLGTTTQTPPSPAFKPFAIHPDLTLEIRPPVRAIDLVNIEACAEWVGREQGRWMYRLTKGSLLRALNRGFDLEEILELLERGSGKPLTQAQVETLRGWAQEGERMTIHRLTVLEVKEPALLEQITRRKRIRDAIRRTLSPRMVAIAGDKLEQVVNELRCLGLHPRVLMPSDEEHPQKPGDAAYLWMAARLYTQLGRFIPLPVRVPASLLDTLSARMTPEELAAAESTVREIISRLADAMDGHTPYPAHPPGDVGAILPVIEEAIAKRQLLEITYVTAGRGERTRRIVEPYRIEWRGGIPYLIAFCHLRQEERVFRVDRIEEITLV